MKQRAVVEMDQLDKKILYFWDLDARQSAKEIAKKCKSNKDTVQFRMNRLLERGIIISTMTETRADRIGYNNIKVFLQFQDFTRETEQEFFNFLKTVPGVGWIVSCSGRWDALFCYWAKSTHEFYESWVKIQNRFSRHILHKEIIFNINWYYYNRKWLNPKEQPLMIKYGDEPRCIELDAIDRQILELLTQDARTQIMAIARKTGESSQTIINRKRKLEQQGVIAKYSINLDYRKLGIIFCKTFIYLQNISHKRVEELRNYCANQPRVFALATTAGAWDFELEFEAENFEQVREIMDDIRLRYHDIVKNYESVIITKQMTPRYAWQ